MSPEVAIGSMLVSYAHLQILFPYHYVAKIPYRLSHISKATNRVSVTEQSPRLVNWFVLLSLYIPDFGIWSIKE